MRPPKKIIPYPLFVIDPEISTANQAEAKDQKTTPKVVWLDKRELTDLT
jgi:hypothetical protein